MGKVQIKRIYEPTGKDDGVRILIDRLWPRGVKKESAHIDNWMKAIAPTTELRKWFHQNPATWPEFIARYQFELKKNDAVKELLDLVGRNETVTLLYAAHDEQHNHALVLRDFINSVLK